MKKLLLSLLLSCLVVPLGFAAQSCEKARELAFKSSAKDSCCWHAGPQPLLPIEI